MSKNDSGFTNMVFTLFLITFLVSGVLAVVYNITKEPIEKAKLTRKMAAIKEVIPEFNNNPSIEAKTISSDGDSLKIYPAKMYGKIVGLAIETYSNNGFNGKIKVMVGFLPDGKINNISVLEHKETPGLGDKIAKDKSNFSNQIIGKDPSDYSLKVKKDGGDVDAITAATISSRAFCEAIQRAYEAYKFSAFN